MNQLPVLGSLVPFLQNPRNFLLEAFREQGNVARFRIVRDSFLLFARPEATREVLRNQADAFTKAPMAFLEVVVKPSMLIQEGSSWMAARSSFRPYHNRAAASADDAAADTAARQLVARLDGVSGSGRSVDLSAEFLDMSIRTHLTRLLGPDATDAHHRVVRRAADLVPTFNERNLALPFVPPSFPFPWNTSMRRAMSAIDSVFDDEIATVRSGRDGHDLLARVHHNGIPLDDEELRNELIGLLFAAFESTYATLSWAIHLLARSPRWQQAIADEVDQVGHDAGPAAWPLTRQVAAEVLRVYPPFPFLPRRAARDIDILGTPVPKGTYVMVSPWVTHRHPEVWDAPETFDPDRFAPTRRTSLAGAYFPFGDGPRICIGQHVAETSIVRVLARICSAYDIASDNAQPAPVPSGVPIRPKGGVWVTLSRRSQQDLR